MPLFQNESKCETFHMKMCSARSFIFMQIKVSFALRLPLKQRHKGTRKWPIEHLTFICIKMQRLLNCQCLQAMHAFQHMCFVVSLEYLFASFNMREICARSKVCIKLLVRNQFVS